MSSQINEMFVQDVEFHVRASAKSSQSIEISFSLGEKIQQGKDEVV